MELNSLVHRWFNEVWNQGREETVDELYAVDAIAHGLGQAGAHTPGSGGFKVFLRNMRSALPDLHIDVEDTIVQGDRVAARVRLRATHLGEGLGVPPTGRHVTVDGIAIARIVNGQVVETWNSWDQLSLLQQIGMIPQTPDRFLSPQA